MRRAARDPRRWRWRSPSPRPAGRRSRCRRRLIADEVSYDRETRRLVASGNVEVLYQGRVLRASRITYDEAADQIRAEGPIVLTDPDGGVLLADAAALTPDLTEGLISSARLLIAGKLQLAAAEVRRSGDRYATPRQGHRQHLHDLRRRPDPDLGDPRLARHPRRRASGGSTSRMPASRSSACRSATAAARRSPSPASSGRAACWCPGFSQSDIYGFGFKLPYYRTLGPLGRRHASRRS